MKSKQVYFASFAASLLFAVLAGCAAGADAATKSTSPEDADVLKTRSIERWNLLIAHKAEKAWDYLTPGYRSTKSREDYAKEMNNRPIHWTKVAYTAQECDADTCKVHVAIDYDANMGGLVGNTHSITFGVETWVRVKGHWYYLPDQFLPTKLGEKS